MIIYAKIEPFFIALEDFFIKQSIYMYLFFDTETTGLPKRWQASISELDNWPRMVQIAWLIFDKSGNQLESQDYIIRPDGFLIPKEAENVHKISTEVALQKGIKLETALHQFAEAIEKVEIIVAHNINFDEKIVGAEFLRKNIPHQFFQRVQICTMLASTDYCGILKNQKLKWPRLSELHIKLFGVDFEEAHDALVDVKACAKCFFELQKRKIINV